MSAMADLDNKVVIDSISANIIDEHSQDRSILVGILPYENSTYSENLELIIKPEVGYPTKIKLPFSGYDMQLFCGDFTNDKKDEIMVRGSFGGSGGFEIGVIYKFENNQIKEIFNQDDISKNNPCSATFKDNYKVHISCGEKKYSINLSSRPKNYLQLAYDENGKVLPGVVAYVDAPNALFPIKDVDNSYYELLIQQRIVGVVNADTLGIIQTVCDFINGKFNVVTKGLYFSFNSNN